MECSHKLTVTLVFCEQYTIHTRRGRACVPRNGFCPPNQVEPGYLIVVLVVVLCDDDDHTWDCFPCQTRMDG